MQLDMRTSMLVGGIGATVVAAPLGVYVDRTFQHLSPGGFDRGFSASEAIGVFGAAAIGGGITGTGAALALHPRDLLRGRFHLSGPRDGFVMAAAIAFGAAGVGANWVSESLRDNAVEGGA